MKKLFKIILILLAIILALYFLGKMEVIQFRWVTADMGWCQNYSWGLKIGGSVVYKVPDRGFSICV